MADETVLRERALVQAGWELVDLLGQLDERGARTMHAARWDAARARADARFQPLVTGAKMGRRMQQTYEGPGGRTRYITTLDYVQPGDRVFEIGPGRGYLAGLFLRDGGAGAYRGIDVNEKNMQSTREILELNGVADRARITAGSIYDLSLPDLEEFGTDLLVCCEVIEHLPDPELAVKTLATALPAGAELLMSVPLHGRLERVWGHFAIFEAARIRDMIETTGLVVHAVSVVDNTWVMVLASHDAGPSARAGRAAAAALEVQAEALPDRGAPRSMQNLVLADLDAGPSAESTRLARHQVDRGADGVVCELTAKRRGPWSKGAPAAGGVRVPVASLRGLRLELDVDPIEDVTACYLDAYAGRERVARWRWRPAANPPAKQPATFIVRPGRGGRFRPVEIGDLESADAFELTAVIKPGSSVRLRVTRAAVIR